MWASSFREVDVPCLYYNCIWGPQNMFTEGKEPGLPDWESRKLLYQKLGLALRGAGPFTLQLWISLRAAGLGARCGSVVQNGAQRVRTGQFAIFSVCFKQVSTIIFLNSAVLFLGCWNRLRKITHKAKETWQNVPAVCCLNTFKWFNDK